MDNKSLTKSKIVDKINSYIKTSKVQATNFLDPLEIIENESIYNKYPYLLIGGYDNAERKRLIIGDTEIDANSLISIIKIESDKKLGHREILGSVLGLGLKRDVLGDILLSDSFAYLFVNSEICEYIINNLKMVGREKVKVSVVLIDEVVDVKDNYSFQNVTLSSLRIDSAISECYGLSRAISSQLVEAEKVKLNYKVLTNSSKSIKQGDLISVRGYGRFIIDEVIGETRKGRIRVTIKKYNS